MKKLLLSFLMATACAGIAYAQAYCGSHAFDGQHRNEVQGYIMAGNNVVTDGFGGFAASYRRHLTNRWDVGGDFQAQFGKQLYSFDVMAGYRLPLKYGNIFFDGFFHYNRYDKWGFNETIVNLSAIWESPYVDIRLGESYIHYQRSGHRGMSDGYSEPLTLTDDFVYDTFDISLSDCIGYALRSRKDLLADRYTLQQKELAVKEAKAGLRPSVSLSAGTGLSQNFEPEGRDSHSWNAGVAASWNLFDSGVTRAAIDEAEAARDKAALSLEKARQDVDLAVREAYYNMREAEHRMNSTADAVGQAQQDYYIAWEKYRAGEGIMLDVIDAQTALSKARLNEISAQYDYVRCKAQVVDAMGTGLTDSERAAAARLDASVLQQAVTPAGARQDRETKGLAARQAEKQQAAEQPGQAAAKAAEAAGTPQAADAAEAGENARAVAADAQETADDVAGELAGNEGAE